MYKIKCINNKYIKYMNNCVPERGIKFETPLMMARQAKDRSLVCRWVRNLYEDFRVVVRSSFVFASSSCDWLK